jgi:hypothetical protein
MVPFLMQRFSVSTDTSPLAKYSSIAVSSTPTAVSSRIWRYSAAFSFRSSGMGASWYWRAQLVAFPDQRLHLDEVHHALQRVLDADGELERHPVDAELLGQGVGGLVEIGAGPVELVDEDDARHVVAVREAPVGLGLRLHAGHALDDEHRAVEHAQAAVHLDVEVDVAGGVDHVDAAAVPHGGHGGGGDGDPPLALLLHVVGRGVAVMDLADAVALARVVEMRSVVVVLPASICAVMPMLR